VQKKLILVVNLFNVRGSFQNFAPLDEIFSTFLSTASCSFPPPYPSLPRRHCFPVEHATAVFWLTVSHVCRLSHSHVFISAHVRLVALPLPRERLCFLTVRLSVQCIRDFCSLSQYLWTFPHSVFLGQR